MSSFDIKTFERSGNKDSDIQLKTITEISSSIISLSGNALRTVKIYTPDLERELYNNDLFCKNLLTLSRGNRHAQVQILVSDISPALKHGHRLINLSQQLTSAIKIKIAAEYYQNANMTFMLIDKTDFIFRPDKNKNFGICSNCKQRSDKLQDFFSHVWEQSIENPQTKRIMI